MGWADAAVGAEQDAQAATPAAQPQAPADTPNAGATPPAGPPAAAAGPQASTSVPDGVSFPATNPPAAEAPVVTSTKPGGIMGLVNSLRDALTGKTTPEIGTDENGNQYVKQTTPSGGAKWARIAAQAAVGAARGFAAGKGGNPGAAVAAGVDAGAKFAQERQQQQQDMSQQARQQNLDRANNQLLTQRIAEQAMAMHRMDVQGTQEAIDFSEKQQDWMAQHAEGGQPVAYVKNLQDLAKAMIKTPGFNENHIQNGLMQPVQLYDKDGKADGFAVYQMKAGANEDMLPAGQTVYHYDGVNDKLVPQQSSQPMKAVDVFAANNAAAAAMNEAHLKAADLANKKADTAGKNAEVPLKKAQTGEANARAGEANANAAAKKPSADDPQIASLGEAIARGSLTEDQIPGFSKNKAAIEAYLAQHHPNLDQKSVLLDAGQRKQVNLANNAIHNLDDVATRLQRRPDLIGKIEGQITQGKELVGTDDRDLGDIITALDNYALASTGAHGVRAVSARTDAKKALLNNFKNGPNGVAAALAAAKGSLQNLASAGKPRGTDGNPYVYNAQQGAPAAASNQPPAIPSGTPAVAAGYSRIWAPGSAVWRDVPTAQVPKNVPGLVVQ